MQSHIYIFRSWGSHILSLQQDSQMIIYMVRICAMQQKNMLGTLKLYVCTINFVGPPRRRILGAAVFFGAE